MPTSTFFTSESVCAGHPDKICDQISDAVLDAALREDPDSRVAVETLVTQNAVVLAGEVTSNASLDYETIARTEIKRLGYTDLRFEFTHNSPITVFIHEQSPEIAQGVDALGAGDQGMMFGFACTDTPEYMPLPILLAHKLAQKIDWYREHGCDYLRPDGKTQVTVQYENNRPVAIEKVVLAVPHDENISLPEVRTDLFEAIILPVLAEHGYSFSQKKVIINGTGVWHKPGPASDTGLTGRKIVVDTYGGYARVGGGCFSGKDPSKVDRSGAYAARYLAKNIVAVGLATQAEVALAYCIGHAQPVMKQIETFGTAQGTQKEIAEFVNSLLDTSVAGIVDGLSLKAPLYKSTAAYGHFGREDVPWERLKTE